MSERPMTFTDKSRRAVRVVFDPGGTPMYCGVDVAALQGYQQPRRIVDYAKRKGWPMEKRVVEYVGEKRRGASNTYCLPVETAMNILELKPRLSDAARWFVNSVVPEAEAIGRQKAEEAESAPKPTPETETSPETSEIARPPAVPVAFIAERLDAIILECALLKQELRKTS